MDDKTQDTRRGPGDHRETYWAAGSSTDVASDVTARVDQYYNYLRSGWKLELWNRCYRAMHNGGLEHGLILAGGNSGEQMLLKANHLRSINQNITNAVTSERPSFDAKAVNNDYQSRVQCQLGQQILDYDIMREKKLESTTRQAVEYAVHYGEGFITKTWDWNKGEILGQMPDTEAMDDQGMPTPGSGKPQWSGTLQFRSYGPWDVIRDFVEDDEDELQWYVVRDFVNRYDLLAQYPDKAEEIMAAPTRNEAFSNHPMVAFRQVMVQHMWQYTDEIEVFYFYHDRTAALPHGREMMLAGTNFIVDGPLKYRDIPVYRIAAGRQPGTAFGYTMTFDLLPIQHAINAQYTTIATNQAAFGIQSVGVPTGANITAKQLGTGLQILEFDPVPGVEGGGMPVGVNLTKTAPETFTWLDHLVRDLQLISGVNSTQRGAPEENIKSGSMAALVVSQALTFTIDLQASYIEALEQIATGSIADYVDFATAPQIALVAGKSNSTYLKTFKGDDLKMISRVVVDVGNPLMKTIAGRLEVAQQLLANKKIDSAADYIAVLTSGRLEPVTGGPESENLCILAENEELAAGRKVQVMMTDLHPLHIRKHKVVLAMPSARAPDADGQTSAVVTAALDHLQQHIQAMKTVDPALLQMLEMQPILPPPPANPESQAAYQAQVAVASDPKAGGQRQAAQDVYRVAGPPKAGISPEANQGRMPAMPRPPKNPLTGDRAEIQGTPDRATPPGVTNDNQ